MGEQKLIQKQKMMMQMIYALIPIIITAVYFYGLRFLVILGAVNITGFLSEYIFTSRNKKPVSQAVFVTNFLFALSLPPTIPVWISCVGIAFGVIFGKMVFGGFGRNVFNPALAGRAFIYTSFGVPMTSNWIEPISGTFGGFVKYTSDAVTQATPLVKLYAKQDVPVMNLLLGNTSGSFGETCAVLIIITGLYLMITKTASFRIIISGIVSFIAFQYLFLYLHGPKAIDPIYGLLSGSFLFGIMYMATDPVSSSQSTNIGRWIYGAIIGGLTALIRTYSSWIEGVTFAILIANMFAPLMDFIITELKKKAKA